MKSNKTWPNFFIVGAPRAGTTSLYSYLKEIPEIYMSPEKEPNYFNSPNSKIIGLNNPKTKKYLKLFENAHDEIARGEATASYLSDPESAKMIYQVVPEAKIIICLRNPVERLYSHHLSGRRMEELTDFHEFIHNKSQEENSFNFKTLFEMGLYSNQIKGYLDIFGSKQVKIFIFEEYTNDIKATLEEILEFLGLESIIQNSIYDVYNASFLPKQWARPLVRNKTISKLSRIIIRNEKTLENLKTKFLRENSKPLMVEEDKKFLQRLYERDVKKLQNILGRKLPWFPT